MFALVYLKTVPPEHLIKLETLVINGHCKGIHKHLYNRTATMISKLLCKIRALTKLVLKGRNEKVMVMSAILNHGAWFGIS